MTKADWFLIGYLIFLIAGGAQTNKLNITRHEKYRAELQVRPASYNQPKDCVPTQETVVN